MNNSIDNISSAALEDLRRRAQRIRIVATDLDGTLFDRQHMMSDENRLALNTLADKGIMLIAATGRSRTSIPESIISFRGVKYLVTANGAKIYVTETDEIIYTKYLSTLAIDYIRPFFSDPEVLCEVFWNGTPHVEKKRYIEARDYGVPFWFSDYFFKSRIPVEDFENAVSANENEIENINFVFGNDEVKERIRSTLAARTDLYELTSSLAFNYEIGGLGVSKAAATDFIAKLEQIRPDEILSFGDNDNDVSMIEYAGIGVATANAVPGALAAADLVTEACDNSGVAIALKLLGLV